MITAPHFHAMAIHFPIALLIIAFLTEIVALLSKNQFYKNLTYFLLLVGTLSVIVAYISGSYAGGGMTDGILQEPIGKHEEAALVTLSLTITTVLISSAINFFNYQKSWAKWAYLLFFTLLIISITRTAFLGGELVFKHGAGIELALPEFGDKTIE